MHDTVLISIQFRRRARQPPRVGAGADEGPGHGVQGRPHEGGRHPGDPPQSQTRRGSCLLFEITFALG